MGEGKQNFLVKLGNQIREKRNGKGMSQAELSRRIYKDKQSLERVENGKINPFIYYLSEIVEGLGITLKELLSEMLFIMSAIK